MKLIPGERSYLQTIARLDTTIKSNKKDMRPSLRSEYERNLAVVDRAIAATRSAAKSNPNDPDAADFMFAAYQSKVDLLNTIADARLSEAADTERAGSKLTKKLFVVSAIVGLIISLAGSTPAHNEKNIPRNPGRRSKNHSLSMRKRL